MNNKKITWGIILGILFSFTLYSCKPDPRINDLQNELDNLKKQFEDNKTKADKEKQEAEANQPFIKLKVEKDEIALDFYPGELINVKIESKGIKDIVGVSSNPAWKISFDKDNMEMKITAPIISTSGNTEMLISGVDDKGQVFRGLISCTLYDYSSSYGTFILNEGSVWSTPSEMGSLIYVSPRKSATPNVYHAINGRWIGACPQDLFESAGKYFVISQNENSDTDGRLTIFDTKTLQKLGNYSDVLSSLDWPTHIAVVDGKQIYIRDNKGIWFFNTAYSANTLMFIEGSKGARKNVMAVSQGKVFFSSNKFLRVIDAESNTIVHEVKFDGNISGIVNADENHIYVSSLEKGIGKIRLINTETYKIEKENDINEENGAKLLEMTFAAAPNISAKGDTIYYSSLSQKVYRHIFSTNTSKLMVDIKETLNPDHTVTYNTVQVHPVTGHVYMNTLKGFGPNYKTNTIYRFDMTGDQAALIDRWENLTRFPAGIFFPKGY